jgi:hypothetical protein
MYFRSILLIVLCSCVAFGANAQLLTISGIIYKKNYSERVAQVMVTNTTKKILTTSNNQGVFHIQAAKGDTLLFQKAEHTSQTFVISGPYDINIYMQPNITLGEVTVREQSSKQELDDVLNQYRKQGTFTNGEKPKALSFLGSPLTAMNELFGTSAKRARHFKEYSKNELDQIEVNKRYNKSAIKKLTPLPDNEIEDFMNYYSPSYQAIKEWNDYDLINYIRKSYDYYKDNKNTLKLKKLY